MSDRDAVALEAARYLSLATFRKSGVMVATPVWAAAGDGDFWVFSAGDAGKVKRLRNSNEARLAVCDARGRLQGEWHDATATLAAGEGDVARALAALRGKYGTVMWLTDVLSRLTGRYQRRAYIKVRLKSPPAFDTN